MFRILGICWFISICHALSAQFDVTWSTEYHMRNPNSGYTQDWQVDSVITVVFMDNDSSQVHFIQWELDDTFIEDNILDLREYFESPPSASVFHAEAGYLLFGHFYLGDTSYSYVGLVDDHFDLQWTTTIDLPTWIFTNVFIGFTLSQDTIYSCLKQGGYSDNHLLISVSMSGEVLDTTLFAVDDDHTLVSLFAVDDRIHALFDGPDLMVKEYDRTLHLLRDTSFIWPYGGLSPGMRNLVPKKLGNRVIFHAAKGGLGGWSSYRFLYSYNTETLSDFSFEQVSDYKNQIFHEYWDEAENELHVLLFENLVGPGYNYVTRQIIYDTLFQIIQQDSLYLDDLFWTYDKDAWTFDTTFGEWRGYLNIISSTSTPEFAVLFRIFQDNSYQIDTIAAGYGWGDNKIISYGSTVWWHLENALPDAYDSLAIAIIRLDDLTMPIQEILSVYCLIHPNPFHSNLTISGLMPGSYHCRMINLAGQVVYTSTGSAVDSQLLLTIPDIHNGYYILELSGEEQVYRQSVLRF